MEMLNVEPGRALLSNIIVCPRIPEEERTKWYRFRDLEHRKAEAARKARKNLRKRARQGSFNDEDLDNALEYDVAPPDLDKEIFQRNIAVMFYSANTPFRRIDNPVFRRALLQGRPDHLELPTCALLSEAWLKRIYADERDDIVVVWKNEEIIVIETDGWTNIAGKHTVNFIL
ncbi:hypothetical protein GN244_ATG07165 [Phytophthora infestans]|uniref:Uncharacterized protein n=1 Tax=Phytophthora infestans TaxID=4787 RepID=A0A833STU4_PHYIN|nr:hypothetical protein GN244_ATG07165 [Phytophthora infestans]